MDRRGLRPRVGRVGRPFGDVPAHGSGRYAHGSLLPHVAAYAAAVQGQANFVARTGGADAFELFRKPSFSIFVLSTFLICIPLAFYFQLAAKAVSLAGIADVTRAMSYGQISEIVFMLLMPLFFSAWE